MGMDLVLLPLDSELVGSDLAVDRLGFHRDYELFGQLHDFEGKKGGIKANAMAPGASILQYDDEGLTRASTDPYGTPLTWVSAKELKKLKASERTSSWNKAILAFITALPDDTVIVLWWC